MTVVELDYIAADIPRVMREVAAAIESGEYGDVQFVAAILMRRGSAPPEVFSWGQAGNLEILGAFSMAHHWILRKD